jgi:predicted transcriptional regulator
MASKLDRQVVLMSIHPKYAQAIFDGRKKVEFRKSRLACSVRHVLVYVTAPVKHVIGFFSIGNVVEGAPSALWKKFRQVSGVKAREYRSYYLGTRKGYAISVKNPTLLGTPIPLHKIGHSLRAPQSYCYCPDQPLEKLLKSI